jgi:hypothetical protein
VDLSELLSRLQKYVFIRTMALTQQDHGTDGQRRGARRRVENVEAQIERLIHEYCAQPRLPEY